MSNRLTNDAAFAAFPGIESVSQTQFNQSMTEAAGALRGSIGSLQDDGQDLHRSTLFTEWASTTDRRAKSAPLDLLLHLSDSGFAWRDIARMLGVSVPALQKWRRGEKISGANRRKLAGLVAACDLVETHYLIHDPASWFEMPLYNDVPITPIDLYVSSRTDLLFDYASGHLDSETVLSEFDADWRETYRSDFEVFVASDGQRSIRIKS